MEREEFKEDDYYLVFVLGYDLLHDKIMKCEDKTCDNVFNTMKRIVEMFNESKEAKNFRVSTYDALQQFLENQSFAIDMELFNQLDYKGGIYETMF